jgi:hypothetical protein
MGAEILTNVIFWFFLSIICIAIGCVIRCCIQRRRIHQQQQPIDQQNWNWNYDQNFQTNVVHYNNYNIQQTSSTHQQYKPPTLNNNQSN